MLKGIKGVVISDLAVVEGIETGGEGMVKAGGGGVFFHAASGQQQASGSSQSCRCEEEKGILHFGG